MESTFSLKWEGKDSSVPRAIRKIHFQDRLFAGLALLFLGLSLSVLCLLLFHLIESGFPRFHWNFLSHFPSRFAEKAGILSAWVGSLSVITVTALLGIPLGMGAGIYLEEYAPKNGLSSLIELNIANLAGVPSILFGLLALGLFVYKFHLGPSILTAGLTLALLILPIVIVATREAIRAVPQSLREAAYALGATKWECVRDHVLPSSAGSVLTGLILALSRALGETAPLVTIGALTYIAFLPPTPWQSHFPYISFEWLFSPYTVLPIQMFNWTSRPGNDFHQNAAAAGLFLITLTLGMNSIAILLRLYLRKKWKQ